MDFINRLKTDIRYQAAAVVGLVVAGATLYYMTKSAEVEEEVEEEISSDAGAGNAAPVAAAPAAAAPKPAAAKAEVPKASAAKQPAATSITKAQLKDVLGKMIEKLTALKVAIEEEKATMAVAGASEEDVEEMAAVKMQEGLAKCEEEIASESNVDQRAIMMAQQEFGEEEDVRPYVQQLREMFFGAEQMEEMQAAAAVVPADMTPDKFITHLRRHINVVDSRFTALLEKAAADTAANGNVTAEERNMYAEMLIMRELDSIMAAAQEECGLEEDVWKGCLIKFGGHPDVIHLMMASHAKQQATKERLLGSS